MTAPAVNFKDKTYNDLLTAKSHVQDALRQNGKDMFRILSQKDALNEEMREIQAAISQVRER